MSDQVDDVFLRASELLDADERAAFLAEACRGEPDLLAQVGRLLDDGPKADSFFGAMDTRDAESEETLVSESSATLLDESKFTEGPGTQIGRYKLLEKLGEGGFGSVWAAEQKEPVRRRVALKIIKLGMDTQQVVARFEAERQALALMDHPNIAKVLDAGATDTGRPYFVMELVKGMAITRYCAQEKLATKKRLNLFIKVCQAIQHAHQKGIIHRDIKPSNIMVTLHDGVPVPKVIDFGIAKATQQELTEKTIYTQYSQFIGTPAYMSPEQAEMSGLDIDTRSDIYSLGVVLYELLTGKTPFDSRELMQSGIDEMRRIIREQEPMRPSTKLSQTLVAEQAGRGVTRPTTKAKDEVIPAHGDSRRLLQELRGDLDWIVMKCLEKDRSRRYETANGLAADLKRHLGNEPVTAMAPSVTYRVGKFIRRNRTAVTVAAVITLLMVAGITSSTWLWVQASRAQASETRQRILAQDALLQTQKNLQRMRIQQAEEFFRGDQHMLGIGYLGQVLRSNPSDRVAAARLVSVLVEEGGFQVPLIEALHHDGEVNSAQFSPDGKRVLTASTDNTARVWDTQSGRLLAGPLRHGGSVNSAQFSPDGQRVVTASVDNTAQVWNSNTGQPVTAPLHHGGDVRTARFSPDGQKVITGSDDHTARVWDASSGQPLGGSLQHSDQVYCAEFSPDGTRAVTGSDDDTARVWDADTGQPLTPPLRHGGEVRFAEFSPDGRWIATASLDGAARVWNATTGQLLTGPLQHGGYAYSARFSPDGQRIVTASYDRTARVWDATTGRPLTQPLLHEDRVRSAQFSPDGLRVLSCSYDRTARVWDAKTGQSLTSPLLHDNMINSAQFSADGLWIVTASWDKTAKIWDAVSGHPLTEPLRHSFTVKSAMFSPDGHRVVTASYDKTARIWDAATGQPLTAPLQHADEVNTAHFSPDGRLVVTASDDASALVWDATTGRLVAGPLLHGDRVIAAEFSPDGGRIVSCSLDRTARIWDARTGHAVTGPLLHEDMVASAQFSPDGHRVVTASYDKTARVWDAATGQPLTPPLRHDDRVRSAQFSPDGKLLVTASKGTTAQIWDARTGQPMFQPLRHEGELTLALFSRDGQRVLTSSADKTARVWDANTGEPLTPPLRHDDRVNLAQFSPDGHRIVTASDDKTARLWDATSGQALTGPLRHEDRVNAAYFSPDGEQVVTASYDQTARVWNVPAAPVPVPVWFLDWAGSRTGRQLDSSDMGDVVTYAERRRQRELLAARADTDFYTRIARWIQAGASDRTISPHATETVPDYVRHRIEENTIPSLFEAIRLAPTRSTAFTRLAALMADQDRGSMQEAEFFARYALKLKPGDVEAQKVLKRFSR